MSTLAPDPAAPTEPLSVSEVARLLAPAPERWWISGGAALDHWLGSPIRVRENIDVSTTREDLVALLSHLPAHLTAWVSADDEQSVLEFSLAPADADLQPVRIFDAEKAAWVLQVNVEDGSSRGWMYKRDPRLQLPWERAVLEIDGIPTGAPEVQLVWKALRPRPEDDVDKDASFPELSAESRAWFERAILSLHPHSTWSIHVRSPLTPAKASWDRKRN